MGFSIKYAVELQEEAVTIDEATRSLARSCEICAKSGNNHYTCQQCPVARAHQQKLETILTLRQLEHEKAQREREKKEKVEKLQKMVEDIYKTVRCVQDLLAHEQELEDAADEFLRMNNINVRR